MNWILSPVVGRNLVRGWRKESGSSTARHLVLDNFLYYGRGLAFYDGGRWHGDYSRSYLIILHLICMIYAGGADKCRAEREKEREKDNKMKN